MGSKNSRKGFTMTELIATLVILGIVIAIAIPGIGALQTKFKKDYYNQLNNSVLSAAKAYYKDNSESMPNGYLSMVKLNYSNLIDNKYIDSINQYNKEEECSGYVALLKANDKFIYKNCMVCGKDYNAVKKSDITDLRGSSNKESDADENICLLAGKDAIGKNYNTETLSDDPLYLYKGNYTSQELKNELKIDETVRLIADGKVAYEIETGKTIYPKNITGINLNKVTTNSAKVNVGTEVIYDGDKPRKIYVYEYEKPNVLNPSNNIPYSGGQLVSSETDYVRLTLNPIYFDSKEEANKYPSENYLSPLNNPYTSEFTRYLYKINDGEWKEFSRGSISNSSILLSEVLGDHSYSSDDKIKFKMEGRVGDKTLYSKETEWYNIKSMVTVKFDLNDDNADVLEENEKKYEIDSEYGALPVATNRGHIFNGWFKGKSGGTAVGNGDKVNGNHTLYAQWTKNRYIITLDVNGGDPLPVDKDKIEKEYMATCGTLPTPTRTGHTFSGWWTDKNGGFKVSANKQIENNITMYARWNRNTYRLIFDPNGGTLNEPFYEIEYDAEYGDLPTPIRTGYSFKGWWTDKNGGTEVSEGKKMGDGNTTIYARWEADTYTITFDANGGTATKQNITVTYDSTYGEGYSEDGVKGMPAATKSGSAFMGWYTAVSGGTKIESTTKVKIPVQQKLYAQWGEKQTITKTTTGCTYYNLEAGIYYIEVIGGGAGGLGKSNKYGGNAARWAGYVDLPGGRTAMCVGIGSAGHHGIGTDPVNGGSTYISSSDRLDAAVPFVEAMGGRNHTVAYNGATVKFAPGINKLQCSYAAGKKCAEQLPTIPAIGLSVAINLIGGFFGVIDPSDVTLPPEITDCAMSSNAIDKYGYGTGGGNEGNGGGTYEGYAGTSGRISYTYVMPSDQWNNSVTCPLNPDCPVNLCKWENWPTS